MGAESTAGIHRTLLDPARRPPQLLADLSNLIVMIAQTGDEWRDTIRLVDIGNPGYQNLLRSPCGLTSHQEPLEASLSSYRPRGFSSL